LGRAHTLLLAFHTETIRRVCESEEEAKTEFGPIAAEALKRRLADMRAARTTKDLVAGRPRLGNDSKQMIIDLPDGYRIRFKANHPKYPKTDIDELDWTKVSRIKIMSIEKEDEPEHRI
jgi:hypothetical protein